VKATTKARLTLGVGSVIRPAVHGDTQVRLSCADADCRGDVQMVRSVKTTVARALRVGSKTVVKTVTRTTTVVLASASHKLGVDKSRVYSLVTYRDRPAHCFRERARGARSV
jgi:hypothetical protein